MKRKIIVTAVIEDGNKILFGKKPPGVGPYPDTVHSLGGSVEEADANLEEAIKREIREEAGIEVEILERLGFDEDVTQDKEGNIAHYIFLAYKVRPLPGQTPTPQDDIKELVWVEKHELKDTPLNPPGKKLFTDIGYL